MPNFLSTIVACTIIALCTTTNATPLPTEPKIDIRGLDPGLVENLSAQLDSQPTSHTQPTIESAVCKFLHCLSFHGIDECRLMLTQSSTLP